VQQTGLRSSVKIIEALIKAGADVNAQDNATYVDGQVKGKTALHIAVENESTSNIKALLKNGAKRNIVDSEGKTPENYIDDINNKYVRQLLKETFNPQEQAVQVGA